MNETKIYSKTADGIAEQKNNSSRLLPDELKILNVIDGKLTIDDFTCALSQKGKSSFFSALRKIERLGLIHAVSPKKNHDSAATSVYTRINSKLPFIEVTELSGEESVQVWAEAQRGARALQEKGFFAPSQKTNLLGSIALSGAQRQILVVEDDESIAQMLNLLLTEKGFSVRIASDIPSGLTLLQASIRFDLVLLDVILPGLAGKDGFYLLDIVRKQQHQQHLPVVMVTSQISDEQVLAGLKAGADGYIFKPIKWLSLYQCIESVIGT